ncbi:histidine kinase [Leptospira kobayashii]|uniref:Histidine kinase n=1 Tax=Leptospira kobayashii TaxID=1917830 RepID=A0ABM7UH91_9LEPT|nr:response regulator [Leptospira kobayashii]BDA78036.1 histidine kinase [Leptospira kobayashii]
MGGNGKKILFVDDDESSIDLIRSTLFGSDIPVEFVPNGVSALEKLRHDFFSVVVIKLNISGSENLDLINRLNALSGNHIILVSFMPGEINAAIDLLQSGVYDYIQKPYGSIEFIHRIRKAIEASEFRSIKNKSKTEKQKQARKHSDLNIRKEKIINGSSDDFSDDQLIGNIRTSLSQGAGFGALVSLIKRIEKKAKREGDDYIIDSSLMESLFENGQAAKRVINLFEEMENIRSNDLSEELLSLSDLYQTLEGILESQRELIDLQNHSVVLGKNVIEEQNVFISGEPGYLRKAFEELLLNALKFSIPNARIYINLSKSPKSMKIDFLNPPNLDQYGNYGIPESCESLIFEPFFRMSKLVYERYPTLDFGLGLTYVDKVIRKHNGQIRSYLAKNQLDDLDASDFVHFEVDIPTVVLV